MPPKKRAASATSNLRQKKLSLKFLNNYFYFSLEVAAVAQAVVPAKRGRAAKKLTQEPEPEQEDIKEEPVTTKDSIINKLKEADKKDKKNKFHAPDKELYNSGIYTVKDNN